jgi:MFS family permease
MTATLLMGLHAAIYVTFLMKSGLNLWQVSGVNLCYMLFVFLLEMPTGAVADIWGRKVSFVLSAIINGIGFAVYALAGGFLGFIIAEIIIALGTTLTSGALKAWLVDSLRFYNWNGELVKVFRLEGRIINVAKLVGGLTGAYLGKDNLSLPFAVAGIGYWLLAVFSYAVMKEEYFQKKNGRQNVFQDIKEIARDSIVYGFQNNIVFLIITVTVVFTLGFQAMNMYWQPRYQPFLSGHEKLGYIWMGIVCFSLMGNEMVRKLQTHFKTPVRSYLLIGLVVGISMVLAGALNSFIPSLSFFFIHEIARGAESPYSNSLLQENIPSNKRATIDSFVSMTKTGAAAIGLFFGGWIAEQGGVSFAWIISGLVIVGCLPLVLFWDKKRNKKAFPFF